MTRRNGFGLLWLVAVIVLLGGCGRAQAFHGTAYDPPRAAPEISGTNWNGEPFHLRDLQGKVVLLFFGYTYCPDICPLTLAELARLHSGLGEQADGLTVLFVSTDPARDTPERLAQYMPNFNPSFYGVFVPAEALTTVKQGYGVYSETNQKVTPPAGGYYVDHNSYIYVIDQAGQLRVAFPATDPKEGLRADVEQLLGG